MVTSALGHPVPQCEQVRRRLGDPRCPCSEAEGAGTSRCNRAQWPELWRFAFYSANTGGTLHWRYATPLSWDALRAQISPAQGCLGRPYLTARLHGPSHESGHMFVANAYKEDATGTRWVGVVDPDIAPTDQCNVCTSATGAGCVIPDPDCQDTLYFEYDSWQRHTDSRDDQHWDDYYDIEFTGRYPCR